MAPVSSFADIRSLLSVLSPREEEVLLLRLEALKYREIANQEMSITVLEVNKQEKSKPFPSTKTQEVMH